MKVIQKICVGHDDTNPDMRICSFSDKAMTHLLRITSGTTRVTGTPVRRTRLNPPSIPSWSKLDSMILQRMQIAQQQMRKNKAELEIKDEFMAGFVISSANQRRFGLLKRDIQNTYKGQDDYPKTFEEAKRLLSN